MAGPRIGITANIFPAERRKFYDGKALSGVECSMVERVTEAGGIPLILPVVADPGVRAAMADGVDGLLLTGGADIDASAFGRADRGWPGQPERDDFEVDLIARLREARRPILGVCRGLQMLNVAFGGTLLQDIQTQRAGTHSHRDQELYDTLRHPLTVAAGTLIHELYGGRTEVDCNSIHHQAIDDLGEGLVAHAWSDDGLIEAVSAPADEWTWAVQWHPEWDPSAPHRGLFGRFVQECR